MTEKAEKEYTPLNSLLLSVRAYNALRRNNINSVEQLLSMTDLDLWKIEGIGKKTHGEIIFALEARRGDIDVPKTISNVYAYRKYLDHQVLKELIQLRRVAEMAKQLILCSPAISKIAMLGASLQAIGMLEKGDDANGGADG